MADNVFDAQIKAVDAGFGSTIRAMMGGIREIINATRGMAKSSAEGAAAAGHAGHAAARSLHHSAEGVREASKSVEHSLHGVEKAEDHAEAHHIRYFRSLGAHVRLLHGHFGELNTSIGEVGSSMKEFLPALGALAAGGSLVGMFEMTHEAAEGAIVFDALAQKIGVTANQMAGLNWAAKESGVPVETMTTGMERLNRTIGMTISGKGGDAAKVFAAMGIKLKDSAGHTRATTDILKDLAEAYSKTGDAALRASTAQILMGRGGQDMLPMLMKGRDAVEEMLGAGSKFADMGTSGQRDKLKEFGHVWGEMDAAAEGFKTRLSTELAPALQPIVAMARDWIMANRDWIAQGLARRVTELGVAFKDVHLKDLIIDMGHLFDRTVALTKGHGELIAIVGAATLVLGSPIAGAVKNAAGAFMLFARIIRVVSVLLMANPLGWLVVAAVAVAAAAYEIYENWEPIKAFFVDLWGAVAAEFDKAWAKIKPIVDAMGSAVSSFKGGWIGRHLGLDDADMANTMSQTHRGANMRGHVAAGPLGQGGAPGLYREGGPALAAVQQKGRIDSHVTFANAPPGMKVQSTSSGIVQPPETSVGYADVLAYGG